MDPATAEHVARRKEVLEQIRRLLIDRLRIDRKPDEIDPDAALFGSGLALDSIDAVDLLIHIKADLGVDVPDDRLGRATLRTVNSLVDLVIEQREAADVTDG